MNTNEKITQLKKEIFSKIDSLIGKKCILLDAPYYHNIGDVLIWEGEKQFIQESNRICAYTASYETCKFPNLSPDVTILFNGGGNLGDIYHEHMEFLLKVAQKYPENKIIVLPQTIYYQDEAIAKEDFSHLKEHKNIILCARDAFVKSYLDQYFPSQTLLVPDMAFCINPSRFTKWIKSEKLGRLIISRNDCEKKESNQNIVEGTISDWPVFEHAWRKTTFLNKIFKRLSDKKVPVLNSFLNKAWDLYAQNIFRRAMLREGVEFISPYKIIETTRLHGCILSILLDKKIVLKDNSYSKNKHFYETWLSDLDSVELG